MTPEEKLANTIKTKLIFEKTNIKGYQINYVVTGNGHPLLLLHGANIGWGEWYPNIAQLAEHFTVYALDLPGAGQSSKIDFQKADLEKDFVNVVENFITSKQLIGTHIIGHSLGGWIALKLAIRKIPIGKIILESSLGFTDYISWSQRALYFTPLAKLLSKTVMRPTRNNMKKFLESVLVNPQAMSEEFIDYFCDSVCQEQISHPLLLLNRLFGFMKLKAELLLDKELPILKNNILVIIGENDPIISFRKITEKLSSLPRMHRQIFSKTGHVPSIEKSQHFNEVALQFLLS